MRRRFAILLLMFACCSSLLQPNIQAASNIHPVMFKTMLPMISHGVAMASSGATEGTESE